MAWNRLYPSWCKTEEQRAKYAADMLARDKANREAKNNRTVRLENENQDLTDRNGQLILENGRLILEGREREREEFTLAHRLLDTTADNQLRIVESNSGLQAQLLSTVGGLLPRQGPLSPFAASSPHHYRPHGSLLPQYPSLGPHSAHRDQTRHRNRDPSADFEEGEIQDHGLRNDAVSPHPHRRRNDDRSSPHHHRRRNDSPPDPHRRRNEDSSPHHHPCRNDDDNYNDNGNYSPPHHQSRGNDHYNYNHSSPDHHYSRRFSGASQGSHHHHGRDEDWSSRDVQQYNDHESTPRKPPPRPRRSPESRHHHGRNERVSSRDEHKYHASDSTPRNLSRPSLQRPETPLGSHRPIGSGTIPQPNFGTTNAATAYASPHLATQSTPVTVARPPAGIHTPNSMAPTDFAARTNVPRRSLTFARPPDHHRCYPIVAEDGVVKVEFDGMEPTEKEKIRKIYLYLEQFFTEELWRLRDEGKEIVIPDNATLEKLVTLLLQHIDEKPPDCCEDTLSDIREVRNRLSHFLLAILPGNLAQLISDGEEIAKALSKHRWKVKFVNVPTKTEDLLSSDNERLNLEVQTLKTQLREMRNAMNSLLERESKLQSDLEAMTKAKLQLDKKVTELLEEEGTKLKTLRDRFTAATEGKDLAKCREEASKLENEQLKKDLNEAREALREAREALTLERNEAVQAGNEAVQADKDNEKKIKILRKEIKSLRAQNAALEARLTKPSTSCFKPVPATPARGAHSSTKPAQGSATKQVISKNMAQRTQVSKPRAQSSIQGQTSKKPTPQKAVQDFPKEKKGLGNANHPFHRDVESKKRRGAAERDPTIEPKAKKSKKKGTNEKTANNEGN